MSKESSDVGLAFEDKVEGLLLGLKTLHAERVACTRYAKPKMYGNQRVPDFELQYELPFFRTKFLIECQDRAASDLSIGDKIYRIKGQSSRNNFLFVHGREIPEATRTSLRKDGVVAMSLAQFADFLIKLDYTLRTAPPISEDEYRFSAVRLAAAEISIH